MSCQFAEKTPLPPLVNPSASMAGQESRIVAAFGSGAGQVRFISSLSCGTPLSLGLCRQPRAALLRPSQLRGVGSRPTRSPGGLLDRQEEPTEPCRLAPTRNQPEILLSRKVPPKAGRYSL